MKMLPRGGSVPQENKENRGTQYLFHVRHLKSCH